MNVWIFKTDIDHLGADIVLCREDRRQLQEVLEVWRNALEKRGLKVSRSKTEYMQAGGVDDGGELRLQRETVKKMEIFKYLGSVVSRDGSCEEEIRRIQAGWLSWRKISGVLWDRKLSAKVKGKMYKCVVRPAIMYGMETFGGDGQAGGEVGGGRIEDGQVGAGSDKRR